IDHEMGDMDVFGTELTCDRLRHRAQSEFRAGKGRETRTAAHAGGRAGEKNVALAARKHQARRLAAGEKAGIARHFPHFAENPLGGVDDRKIHIGADVENANLQRGVFVGVAQEGHHLVLLSCIERPPEYLSVRRLDFLDERRELFALAAADKDRKTFGRKFLGDLTADEVPGADNGYRRVSLFQGLSPQLDFQFSNGLKSNIRRCAATPPICASESFRWRLPATPAAPRSRTA